LSTFDSRRSEISGASSQIAGSRYLVGVLVFAPLQPEDPSQVSGYVLRARLGAGGMGRVYLSSTPGGRPVALKLIRPDFANDPEFRRRFGQEVQAAQRVNGVYTAQLIDAGPDGETPWLASAYVPGPSLADAVREHGPLPTSVVRPMIAAVALSLEAIHLAGVVHRDLKPHNIILAADGPRVIDFGVSRAFEGTYITVSGSPIGTPAFMSPEQADGVPAAPPSDVFSLGAVMYFAATGRSAFGEGQMLTVLRRVSDAKFDLTGCPAELRSLVEACLAKDPAPRPTTAEVVAACGGAPRFTPAWLPAPVTAGIETRIRQLTDLLRAPAPAPATPLTPAIPAPTGRRRRLGLIGAAALVAAGIVAGAVLTAALRDGSSGDGSHALGPNVGATTTGVNAAASSATAASPSGTPSASDRAPQWTGTVTVADHGVNLDSKPPKVGDNETVFDSDVSLIGVAEDYIDVAADGPNLVKWTGAEVPTEQQCADLVSTQGIGQLRRLVANDRLCLRTDQGRVATLTVQNLATDFTQGFKATATVWPLTG
jgi:eukaryotic-like serine/threonine-protein kinase